MMRKTWMPVCKRRMQLMCVELLLSLTERFVYGSGAFFFLLESFVAPTLHLSINFCSWWKSVIYYTQPCCSFCFASLWNVHLYLHRSDPVFCTCIYIFGAHAILFSTSKTFDFFWKESSRWTDLTCPHDEGRLLLGEQWSTCTSLLIQHCKRRCPMSSRLSFLFGSLQKLRRLWTRSWVVSAAPSSGVPSTRCKTARRGCVTTSLRI